MEKPKVSVIIPVYNVEHYLHKCIESVLTQDYKEIEVILVNDGSKDKSGTICDNFAKEDNRVRVFHKENGGVSAARNFGIEKAKGHYLCFIDSDDWLENGFFFNFGLHRKTDEDILVQGYNRVRSGELIGEAGFQRDLSDFSQFFIYAEKNDLLNSPCFKLFKRSIIIQKNIQFNTDFSLGEDHIFSLEYILHCETFKVSSFRGYNYRMGGNADSLTTRLVDIDSFKKYISMTHYIRMNIGKKFNFGTKEITELKRETNKWVIFLCHKLLDSRRNLSPSILIQEFKDIKGMFILHLGLPKRGVKANAYNYVFCKIMTSTLINDLVKLKVLKKLISSI